MKVHANTRPSGQMTGFDPTVGYLPTPGRELLLQAALLPDPASSTAYRAWSGMGENVWQDPALPRILPLLHPRLASWGIGGPPAAAANEAYRRVRTRNRMLFRRFGEILQDLSAQGIKTLVLKGAALAVLHYRDLGLRPMSDFDLWVPPAQAEQARAHLERQGWTSSLPGGLTAPFLALRHALELRSPAGEALDLHWSILALDDAPGVDPILLANAVPLDLGGRLTRALDPTDQLLHVCIHGARWNPVPPLRWVADALTILASTADRLDWERLAQTATACRLTLPLGVTLGYLRARMGAAVPEEFLGRLRAVELHWGERAEHRFWSLPPEKRSLGVRLAGHWAWHRRLTRRNPGTLGGFLAFLRQNWGVKHWWQLPRASRGGGNPRDLP